MWLVESYSKIAGLSDIVGGALSVFGRGKSWLVDVAKGAGKVLLWESLAKAKDVDFLIKQWFEGLNKEWWSWNFWRNKSTWGWQIHPCRWNRNT